MALLLLPIPWVVNSAGLGKLAVLSSLGQPFRAEIDLLSHPGELANLSSRIASPAAYEQADFLYNPALTGARLNVRQLPNGQAYLEVTSSRSVNEPFLHLLVELVGGRTRFIRAYTVLIDPPGFGPDPVAPVRSVAVAAPPAAEAGGTVSRKITARVEEKTAAPKGRDVARKLKSEAPDVAAADSGMTPGLSNRINILEEQSAVRAKAHARLVERIAELEKTVQGMQRLLETRKPGMAVAPKPAAVEPPARKPEAAKPKVVAAVAPKPAAVEPPAQKPEAANPKVVAPAAPEKAPPDIKKEGLETVSPATRPLAQRELEKTKSKISPPPPESSLVDSIVGMPLLLIGGGVVILLGGLAFWMSRRRTEQEVTPEGILSKLLTRDPSREDIQIKLLEFYAARKDMPAFHSAADTFNKLTGGQGEAWLKVAAMGYALDPGNPLYEAGRPAASAATAANEAG